MYNSKRRTAWYKLRDFFRVVVKSNASSLLALKFVEDGVCLAGVSGLSFEIISSKLREEGVLNASTAMLRRVVQVGNWRRVQNPLISGIVNVKIFLAAYMITSWPSRVFETTGLLESTLYAAARPMLECFHNAALVHSKAASSATLRKEVVEHLSPLLCTYLEAFKVVHPKP
jgi:hypothetical protein